VRSHLRSLPEYGVLTALAALVALLVHQLAYLTAFPLLTLHADHVGDHRHLSTQWALITPLAVSAAAGVIVRQVRSLGLAPGVDWRPLALLGAGFFAGQEAIESVVQTGGLEAVAVNPATWIGLLLAPALARAVVAVLRQASELAARCLERPHAPALPACVVARPTDDRARTNRILGPCSPRGPPRLIRH